MKRILAIFLLLLFFAFGMAVNLRAEDDSTTEPSEQELLLLELINEARRAPLDMAASLGMDTEQILRDLPEMNDILINGLDPLKWNEGLYTSSAAHNNDMFARNYFSSVSPEGIGFADRIISNSDQRVLLTGESVEMVSFRNFMNPDDAVYVIFENMLRDELSLRRVEKRNILNPDLEEVGISIQPGNITLCNEKLNVYLAVCDFATFMNTSEIERQIFDDINRVRCTQSEQEDVFYPALKMNDLLNNAAREHLNDMMENTFFGNISSNGDSPVKRIGSVGYHAVSNSETIGALISDRYISPKVSAQYLFDYLLAKEIEKRYLYERKTVLSLEARDIGLGFDVIYFDVEEGDRIYIYMLVAEFASLSSVFSGGENQWYESFYVYY